MGNSDRFSSLSGRPKQKTTAAASFYLRHFFVVGLLAQLWVDWARWNRNGSVSSVVMASADAIGGTIEHPLWWDGTQAWIKLCAAVFACAIGVNEARLDVIVSIKIGLISLEIPPPIVHGLLRVVHGYFNNFLSFFCIVWPGIKWYFPLPIGSTWTLG